MIVALTTLLCGLFAGFMLRLLFNMNEVLASTLIAFVAFMVLLYSSERSTDAVWLFGPVFAALMAFVGGFAGGIVARYVQEQSRT